MSSKLAEVQSKQMDKVTKRVQVVHDYILKNKSKEELFHYINSDSGKT